MFGSDFYYSSIRKYITVFGSMFADIQISRINTANVQIQAIPVPLAYGPREAWLQRIAQNPDLNAQVQIQLPRMSFEITGFRYDGSRKLPTTTKITRETTDKNKFRSIYTPVPWDIDIQLSSYVRNADDGVQILEQIAPYFGPEWNVSVKLIPEMDITVDVPIILTGMNIDDAYNGSYDNTRTLIHTYSFTMKAWLYGPVKRSGIIKRADVNSRIPFGEITAESMAAANVAESYFVQPGLYANGVGTTNPAASVNYRTISANSNWSYAANTTFNG